MVQTTPQSTARGHEEPFARQFSIFLVNRVGQMKDLMDLCVQEKIRLVGLSVIDSVDWAVVRAVFDNPGKAREVLRQEAMAFTETEVLLIEMSGEEAMSEVCAHLLRGEINIHFAYPLTIRQHNCPVMALHVDDPVLAKQILIRHGVVLLGDEDLADPT